MDPTPAHAPTFFDLSPDECNALLARHNVAHLAYAFRDRVDIEPIHYVFAGGVLHFRTSPGSKLTTLKHHPWVALEVDEIDALFDWRSVVVHGTIYLLGADGTEAEQRARRDAVSALRRLVPGTLTDADPTPFRDVVMQLHIDKVTGRGARTT